MEIKRGGSQSSTKGPADYFTGAVRIDPLFQTPEPARVAGASVTFEPGARTAWHIHPLGQTLIVTSGLGWAQRWGGPIEEIRPGDVVWFSPEEKHWHGATPTTAMTHMAIQERLDGKTALVWGQPIGQAAPILYELPDNAITDVHLTHTDTLLNVSGVILNPPAPPTFESAAGLVQPLENTKLFVSALFQKRYIDSLEYLHIRDRFVANDGPWLG